ncbi:hypothetical protein JHK87_005385 [Glycine soja]|nr:hypothetical protein JHK87_005385 [Glycine soja]
MLDYHRNCLGDSGLFISDFAIAKVASSEHPQFILFLNSIVIAPCLLFYKYGYDTFNMYIKQVVIEGFKSYREQIATEPFSSKVNCVVGANGSGKTNFFHAIRFVLSDLFQNLRGEDRQALLHEGAGHQVLSAFVEIVFDNSDNRIPVDKEEVRLRRTIGFKKDEYFLDGKHITKTEVMNLLESAGFSRSNPYYVVQQGKIASLTLMKDSERLDLLKEIGGTRVYEERRRESNKRKQIIQVVQYLDERLKELDEEKEELRKYQQLDKQRKSLEYAIYSKEVQDAQQKLTEIEDARAKVSDTSARKYNDVLDAHEKSKDLENTLKDVTKELQNFNKEKEVIEKRRTVALKKHTELELDVKDLQEKISGNTRAKEDAARQLEILEKEIQDSTAELGKIVPLHEDQVQKEKDIVKRATVRCDADLFCVAFSSCGWSGCDRASDSEAQVFARTVICKNLDVASRVARSDGDQVSKKGSMTGGFYDHRRSRLRFMNIIKQNADTIHIREEELEKVRFNLQDILYVNKSTFFFVIDQKINEIVAEQQKIDAKCAHDKSVIEQLKQDIANANKQKLLISKALTKKEKSVGDVQNQIEQLNASIAMKKAEMGTELIDHLTPEEKKLLSDLNPEIKDLKEKLVACKTDRIETEARRAELDTNLTTNLRRRKQELEAVISSADADSLVADAESKWQELSDAKILVDDAIGQLRSVTESINDRTRQIKKIKDELNKLKSLEDEYERKLQEDAKELEQLQSKKNTYAAKEEEYAKKIRELGPLTSDAFEAYRRRNIKDLHKMLHRCNEQLQQFSHVNKKALDQYINFTEQREELQKRQAELDAGDEKIKELITVLDQRKDESIERTFKGVARHFREVFSELVLGGHGHLVMMKKKDGDHDDDEDEDGPREANPEGRVEKMLEGLLTSPVGMSLLLFVSECLKVSFTGQGETQSMKQLSGGQKTVVALTLIFAIQRCDPAPFYLFDEIDAALDPQYRTAVGNMIRRLADIANTQFITTTFRPELVKVADKIYGVTHKNRVSRVNVVSKEDALEFIEHDQTHNAE